MLIPNYLVAASASWKEENWRDEVWVRVKGELVVCVCSMFSVVTRGERPDGCSCVRWAHRERRECSTSATVVDASARREYCYGWCASQERINFVVPTTPRASSAQPLGLPFAYHGFREQRGQCDRQGNWRLNRIDNTWKHQRYSFTSVLTVNSFTILGY